MKKIILLIVLTFSIHPFFAQNAYIEVKGEPNLSVFLNSGFKGKTTAEFNGLIIENVTAGKNLIKIVKEGYTPFEETIVVKPGEVLAYKVKPFTKHVVHVSEEGNTEETSKKAVLKTGKLAIQSVPIEIKITIPDIEGIDKSAKTKDKWLAEEIPTGSYKITFTYNQKVITKTISIVANETTSLFVNMLSGDFKTSNTLDERKAKEREDYLKYNAVSNFIDSICTVYKYKPGLTKSEFRRYNEEAGRLMDNYENYAAEKNFAVRNSYSSRYDGKTQKSNVTYIYFRNGNDLYQYSYDIIPGKGKDNGIKAAEYYNKIVALIKSKIPKEFITEGQSDATYSCKVSSNRKGFTTIEFKYYQISKNDGSFWMSFNTI
nr:hypothetical protein [uncultured Flavobacterium sp.]